MEKKTSSIRETKKAYADSVCVEKHKFGSPEYQKCSRRADKQRNLDWKGTPFMSVKKFGKHAKIVGPHNDFEPDKVTNKLAIFGNKIKVKLARESSPAVYIDGNEKVLKQVASVFEDYADEVGMDFNADANKKVLRLWFD